MNKLLKYLILFIIAFAIFNNADNTHLVASESLSIEDSSEQYTYDSDSSFPETFLVLQNQNSSANFARVHSNSKRSNSAHKYNFKSIKSGRSENSFIRNSIFNKSIISHYSFIKPIHRLISLGKLII